MTHFTNSALKANLSHTFNKMGVADADYGFEYYFFFFQIVNVQNVLFLDGKSMWTFKTQFMMNLMGSSHFSRQSSFQRKRPAIFLLTRFMGVYDNAVMNMRLKLFYGFRLTNGSLP